MHDPEKKAAVVAALIAGEGVCEVAREHGVALQTVSRWKSEIPEIIASVPARRAADMGDLLVRFLDAALGGLTYRHEHHYRDPDWLKNQTAQHLAALDEVTVEKSIRLFEAQARANGRRGD